MDQQEAITKLHELLKPGDTVHCILRHASRSGMTRAISPVIIRDGEPVEIDYLVGPAIGYKFNRDHSGLTVEGCGMDMGFEMVYNLGRVLWPDGFETPPGYMRNGPCAFDKDGGYALRHRWI